MLSCYILYVVLTTEIKRRQFIAARECIPTYDRQINTQINVHFICKIDRQILIRLDNCRTPARCCRGRPSRTRAGTTTFYYQKWEWFALLIQSVQEKLCFFQNHCNPSLAYIAVRGLQSSQRNASVSHSFWLLIFVQPIAAQCWRGRGGKLSRILEKEPM